MAAVSRLQSTIWWHKCNYWPNLWLQWRRSCGPTVW